jgi:hypothetical protein
VNARHEVGTPADVDAVVLAPLTHL